MIDLNCKLIKSIQRDFNSLWTCKERGTTLEISTPYLLPDSTLLSVFLTKRGNRYIVCDAGSILEVIEGHSSLPKEEVQGVLQGLALRFAVREGKTGGGGTLFFKDTTKPELISSLIFDLASFATSATGALTSLASEPQGEKETTFSPKANAFLRSILPARGELIPRGEVPGLPGVKFSAVANIASRLWIFSYVTGSTVGYFKRSIAETAMNFDHVWESNSAKIVVKRTIPLLDTDAHGYELPALGWQLDKLHEVSRSEVLKWSMKERVTALLS